MAAGMPDGRLVCAHCIIAISEGSVNAYKSGRPRETTDGLIDERVRHARVLADDGYQLSTPLDGPLPLYAVTMVDGTALCARHTKLYWGVAADRVRDMQWEAARARRRVMG